MRLSNPGHPTIEEVDGARMGSQMGELYPEGFGDRLSASFGGRGKVVFEVIDERGMGPVPAFTIRMYQYSTKQEPKVLGQVGFVVHPDRRAEIQSFGIEDWNETGMFGHRLLKWFIGYARSKKRVKSINGQIFGTDMHTGKKLDVFRSFGFDIREMGSMAGHMEYAIEKRY